MAGALTLLFFGILRWPRFTASSGALLALLSTITSGNLVALVIAAALIGFTLLVGDGVCRLVRGREAAEDPVSISLAAGCVSLGALLLILGELELAKTPFLPVAAVLFVLARRRRVPALIEAIRRTLRQTTRAPCAIEAVWVAIVALVLASGFIGALRPEVSWDAIAYHFPQISGFAEHGRLEPSPNVYPQSFLWQNHEAYLALGFLCGGERVVRFLHLAVGLGAFAAALVLARRVGTRGSGLLVLLALAAFPAACLQLKDTYNDLACAFFLTAAAAELTAPDREWGRSRLSAFLFGGATATKLFAIFGVPAFAFLFWRRGGLLARRLPALVFLAILPLLPWWEWSQSRAGFFLAPYVSSPALASRNNPFGQTFSPPEGPPSSPLSWAAAFLRLPFDFTFHADRFVANGDGSMGFLPLFLVLGIAGWDRRRVLLFSAIALAALLSWYVLWSLRLIHPSIRYLIPVYPLYAVFAAQGLDRLTEGFRGSFGKVAALLLAALAIVFPAQLLSVPFDAKVAVGSVSREQALAAYLPAYPLWRHVAREDRVVLWGEWDHYHCPAEFIFWDRYLPQVWSEERWREAIKTMRITHILYRSDIRDYGPLLQSWKDAVVPIETRGPATLYRIDALALTR